MLCHLLFISLEHAGDAKAVSWHPSLGVVISAGRDGRVRLWDPRTAVSVATLAGHEMPINRMKWNNSGRWFVTGSKDSTLKLWDIRTLSTIMVSIHILHQT